MILRSKSQEHRCSRRSLPQVVHQKPYGSSDTWVPALRSFQMSPQTGHPCSSAYEINIFRSLLWSKQGLKQAHGRLTEPSRAVSSCPGAAHTMFHRSSFVNSSPFSSNCAPSTTSGFWVHKMSRRSSESTRNQRNRSHKPPKTSVCLCHIATKWPKDSLLEPTPASRQVER